MANAIIQVSENEFHLSSRGSQFILKRKPNCWEMTVLNAAVRAWNRGYAIPKEFPNLASVEEKYKTWRGLTALVNENVQEGIQ